MQYLKRRGPLLQKVETLVVGAGAVGGTIAAMLQASGHATGLLVRDMGCAPLRAVDRIRLDHASGKAVLTAACPPIGTRIDAFSPRRVLVAVKYPALDAVAASLRDLPTDVPIISCLNGVSSTRILRQARARSHHRSPDGAVQQQHPGPFALSVDHSADIDDGEPRSELAQATAHGGFSRGSWRCVRRLGQAPV